MIKEVDVLIIGAGVAGCVAASVLAKRNLKVAIASKLGGATMQSSGAIDAPIARQLSEHAIGKMGDALAELKTLVSDVELIGRSDSQNIWLATQIGTIKSAMMAQRSQSFDLSSLNNGDSIGLIGFSGLPSFDCERVSQTLQWSISRLLTKDVRVHPIKIDFRPSSGNWQSMMEMSSDLDRGESLRALEGEIQKASAIFDAKTKVCFIAPVLGRTKFKDSMAMQNDSGRRLFCELLGAPHSVPGQRLNDALMNGLARLPVEIIGGEAIESEYENAIISKVIVDRKEGGVCEILPRSVILASGRFFAGGFSRQGMRREKVFGLSLWHENKLIEDTHIASLTQEGVDKPQAIFHCGLRVDERLRPLDRTLDLFAHNLFAAGSSIGGYDALGSEPSLGYAALSGYLSAFHTLAGLFNE